MLINSSHRDLQSSQQESEETVRPFLLSTGIHRVIDQDLQ
jgi:hypothetical protein